MNTGPNRLVGRAMIFHWQQRNWSGLALLFVGVTGLAVGAGAAAPDFKGTALPFIKQYCLECHGEKTQKAGLDLSKSASEATLLKEHKLWKGILHQVNSGEMPPKKKPQPSPAELTAFNAAIEQTFTAAEKNAPLDPGRVTLRRLNRAEYNATVRDLLQVDFNAAEDFPADDIGHGFDNIGDVLTISPIHLERYLAAADGVALRAIALTPEKPPQRTLASKYLSPGGNFTTRFRPLDKAGKLHTTFNLTTAGEFKFNARVYGLAATGTDPVRMTLAVDGKDLKEVEVAGSDKQPQTHSFSLRLPIGTHDFAVNFLNPSDPGELPRTLFVEWLQVEGPSDTRPEFQQLVNARFATTPKDRRNREFAQWFVTRAFRRPATPVELDRYTQVADAGEATTGKWDGGVQQLVKVILCSPKFLFRVEQDPQPQPAAAHPLDDWQLASRLSYFLWSTMPDEELFALAAKGQLTANLPAQVRRMLQDPKAEALTKNFALQWLQLQRLQTSAPDSKLFPAFNESLRFAMQRETELFFGEIVREDRSVLDLVDGNYTYLNESLAKHYGIADTAGNWLYQKKTQPDGQPIPRNEFVRVALPMKERGGLLTHASVLTVTSNPTRTSPVKRGKWVLEQILGTPPPPPPPNVPELEAQNKLTGTLRQRMEQHRENPSCANCHLQMDALGFAFENYDAIGRFRAKTDEGTIDPSGKLPDGKAFQGPAELKEILKAKQELVVRNLAEKLLTYGIGRGLEFYDNRALNQICDQTARGEYKFSTLLTALVQSDPFRLRRGTALVKANQAAE